MLGECGVPEAAHDDFIARVRAIGAHNRMNAYAESAEVLRELRGRGVALAICSNWDWDLHEAIESAGLTGAVDVVVSSAPRHGDPVEVGAHGWRVVAPGPVGG